MPTDAGDIYSAVRVKLDKLSRDIKSINSEFDKITKGASDTSKKSQGAFSKFFSFVKTTGIGTFVGLSAAIGTAVKILKVSAERARDAQEVYSKFDTVFENIGEKANETADEFADSFGLADSTARELLGTTGDLLTGFGATEDQALSLAERLNRLAVDTASFSNIEGGAERASKALTAALFGEREQVKQLGIVIREADVQSRLLERGQAELTGTALSLAKAEVTLDLAYEQSAKAIGDYERTQDSAANAQRRAEEATKELAEAIGSGLLPALAATNSLWAEIAGAAAEAIKEEAKIEQARRAAIAGNETLEQEIILLEQRKKSIQENTSISGFDARQTVASSRRSAELREEEIARIDEQIEAVQRRIDVEKRLAEERAAAAAEAQRLAQAEIDRQKLIQSQLDEIATAFGKTEEGKIEALEDEIARFEEYAELYQAEGPRIKAVLDDLRNELGELTEENASLDEATTRSLEVMGERWARAAEYYGDAADKTAELGIQNEFLRETVEASTKSIAAGFEDIGLALAEGESGWKSLGKVSLQVLAEILRGIGAELAARAALATLSFRFSAAGAALAGSAAAYIASGLIAGSADKFQDGGIVPGTSYSGDSVPARVNSGEMVLTREDQARLFEMIRSGQGGGTLVVQMYIDGRRVAESSAQYYNNGVVRVEL